MTKIVISFEIGKSLMQGDPFSPILFNMMADVFSKMLIKAANESLISGMLTRFRPGGITSLQYADDTLLFLKNNVEASLNLKWILSIFEKMSGMRINFEKCDLVTINFPEEHANIHSQVFGCEKGKFPLKYLGVSLHFSKLKKEDLQPVIDLILKRPAGWRGRLLSYAARITLIGSCLASIPVYLMSAIKFPSWAMRAINSQMAHCLWDNYEGHCKYHLARLELVAMKKEYGGLGISNIRELNICLSLNMTLIILMSSAVEN
jgi:hypothetical protein